MLGNGTGAQGRPSGHCEIGWLTEAGRNIRLGRARGAAPHCDLALPAAQNALPAQLHTVREGWRHHQWCSFLYQGRHETEELWEVPVNVFEETDFEKTPVGLLATASPATFHNRADASVTQCCWPGCSEPGTWRHVAWTCPPLGLCRAT